MLTATSTRLGLRQVVQCPITFAAPQCLASIPNSGRCFSTIRIPQSRVATLKLTSQAKCLTSSPCRTRKASTVSQHADPTPATSAGQQNPAASSVVLDWNSFFRLRTSRRYYSLASSLFGLLASATGTFYFLVQFPDQSEYVVKLIPLDPILSTGIAVSVAMFAGWLLGPIFGNGLWRMLYRKRMPEFTIKERAFFDRIKKHRVNPSGASTNNPVPDFYGEKIGSVSGYRRWLKDQRAFNRKRGGNYTGA
ncbi:uncharacterized protein HMPREF1541_06785 [Cyphellophora europaea CBS 101466]|uniref:Presequence translocated-associated motor subunit PAM17 n=1 Tax=Cyphellophora europaea (strain CBS 101466) TaxID=1220924 RepID=W2RQK2_CYPE1|nr:uncharacterized protein HMPREF1541_06785 [Cyphellophora europaea CBS 101466]ETN38747.1 hypothetical protein HMPREF1541_06785 [Cyphellophora europaea CBS 101466]